MGGVLGIWGGDFPFQEVSGGITINSVLSQLVQTRWPRQAPFYTKMTKIMETAEIHEFHQNHAIPQT